MSSESDTVVTLNAVTVAQQATEIVCAYVVQHHVPAHDLPSVIARTHAAVSAMYAPPAVEPSSHAKPSQDQIDASVRRDGIVSFIDGKPHKSMKRHLTANGFTPETYRAHYGLPADYPMVSADYSAKRSALAKAIQLGVPAPRLQTAA